jgi:hypothetical protein
MTTTVNANPANEPLTVNTETEYVPAGGDTDREYAPTGSDLPETTEEKKVEHVANAAAHKAAKTEQNFDTNNSNLFSK